MLTSVNKTARRYLDAALTILESEGPAALTIRTVGEAADVTGAALYRHFRNKNDLLRAVFSEISTRWLAELSPALEATSPGDRLRIALERYFQFALENPRLYRVLSAPPKSFIEADIREELERVRATTHQFLSERVRECMDAGIFKDDDPADVAATVWAFLHGLVSTRSTMEMPTLEAAQKQFYSRSLTRLINGLA